MHEHSATFVLARPFRLSKKQAHVAQENESIVHDINGNGGSIFIACSLPDRNVRHAVTQPYTSCQQRDCRTDTVFSEYSPHIGVLPSAQVHPVVSQKHELSATFGMVASSVL